MKTIEQLLMTMNLFKNINPNEILNILNQLNPHTKKYEQDTTIFHPGETNSLIGIVLKGSIQIYKDDYWGNRSILTELGYGELFGEVYALTNEILGVTVKTTAESEILFIDIKKILECSKLNNSYIQLVTNLLSEFAQKNLLLTRKIDILSKQSTREKVLTYLSAQSLKSRSSIFEIPFNRQELADYLCVDRSALSNELSKLKKANYIDFKKNKFILKKQ